MPFFDNTAGVFATGVAELETASWTISGINRHLVAGASCTTVGPAPPDNVKWGGSGGVNLIRNGSSITFGSSNVRNASIWELVAPSAANQTLYAIFPVVCNHAQLLGSSFTDVSQSTPSRARASGTANDITITGPATTTASTANGDLVVDFVKVAYVDVSNPILNVGANQVSRIEIEGSSSPYIACGMSTKVATGVSVTMSWDSDKTTGPDTVFDYAIFALPLRPLVPVGTLMGKRFYVNP